LTSSRNLPAGWALEPLGDLGEWIGGGTPSKDEHSYWREGSIPWVSPKDMKTAVIADSLDHITEAAVKASATKLIEPESVLFVTRSGILEHTLPVARAVVPVTVNQDIKALKPASPLNANYIAWGARANAAAILRECSKDGTTVASVDTTLLQGFRIPIAPQEEQHRIVEAIESYSTRLDVAVATLERVQRNLKRYRASVLKAAVEGRLVPAEAELARAEGRDYEPASVLLERILAERRRRWEEAELAKMKAKGQTPRNDGWKAEYQEPVAPDAANLPSLPGGWTWATVDQLASHRPRSVQSGPFGSNLRHSEFQESGKLVIGIDNVQDGYFSMGSENRIPDKKFQALEKYRARPGDVLVTVMATIGRVCVVPEDLEPAIITKHVYRVTVERGLIAPRYLHLALWGGPVVRAQIFGRAQGQTRPGLNGTIIKQLHIPLPPRQEQDRIVTEADRLLLIGEDSGTALAATTRRCARLRQSILKWAFEGRLADQDPTDEPASVLLDRIRAEREAAPSRPSRSPRRTPARRGDHG
jgi:type I restriction enzyme S subunit